MRTTSASLLEFEALRELLGRYVASPLGRAELDRAAPRGDRVSVENELAEVAEAVAYLEIASRPQPAARGAAVRFRFDGLPDPAEALGRLRIEGAALEPKQIQGLAELLDRASDIRGILLAAAPRFPKLAARAAAMVDFRGLLKELAGKILPDGTVADDASPELARLRREIERQRRLIEQSLERFLRAHREDGLLQEEFITIRNERFVVPVVAGQRWRIEGVVHGASGSGHTLFIEPLETIELNNELVRLVEEEAREVHRILLELSARLRERLEAIARTAQILGELEWLFARAAFARDFGAVTPRFSPAGARRLYLRDARHPLLEDVLRRQRRSVVPFTLELDGGTRVLLISGPNSGGKTVTLKTVGLLALMAQAAIPVTCAEAELPFFDQVLADFGDAQSIQESLSTFTAHMARIRSVVEEATADSLVLLDELGRATDPDEGGALGIAILEHLRRAGAFTLASTHLAALKVYGATTPGVINASMGFDEATLAPNFQLRIGAPGKSAGLDIAARLGLPSSLLERARTALGAREQDVARFIRELHEKLERLERQERELREERERLETRERSLAAEWQRRESAKLAELERRFQETLEKFEQRAAELFEQLRQSGVSEKRARQRVARLEGELREQIRGIPGMAPEGAPGAGPHPLREGVRVRLRDVREPARVRRLIGDDRLEVEAGLLRMQVSRDEVLEVLPETALGARRSAAYRLEAPVRSVEVLREINVIGQHAEEAVAAVDKFLDSAALASIERVRIVHGHGMGVLKRAIADLLSGHPHVARFYPAPPHEGGAGATIVELKE
ncbi:MAG: endonuclease MutS2 [Bryobacteraceae bacterium]|nr:endonuclease MutS2 [Bryobacteraceae bacterium]